MANVFKIKYPSGRTSAYWYGKVKEGDRWGPRVRLYTDKRSSQYKLNELQTQAEQRDAGLRTAAMDYAGVPVAQHVTDYLAASKAEGRDADHLRITEWQLGQMQVRCGWKRLADLTSESLRKLLSDMSSNGNTASYQNDFIKRAKAFAGWLRREGRMTVDPFANVKRINERYGVKKRARRPLADEQASALLNVVPPDRRLKYAFGLYAGLRRSELADLRWGDLRLNALPHPFIQLRQEQTKNGKADVLPLHPYLVTLLEDASMGDPSERVVSSVPDMKTMAVDLVRAGVAVFTTNAKEGVSVKADKHGKRWVKLADGSGRRVDFHALRHTFATNLDRVGCSTTTRKALLRHADEGVTERYTHARISELFHALRQLPHPQTPGLQKQGAKKTGTDASAVPCADQPVDHRVDQTPVGQGQAVAGIGKKKQERGGACLTAQPRYTPALDAESQPLAGIGGQDNKAAKNAAFHGRVPKWSKGTDCKSVIRGFESHLGL